MKPCGAAWMDAIPLKFKKMQAAAAQLGIDDIITKEQGE
jgi:hypothetical protein